MITLVEPSLRYATGTVRGLPDVRPVVVSKRTGNVCTLPPMTPPVNLYKKTVVGIITLSMSLNIGLSLHVLCSCKRTAAVPLLVCRPSARPGQADNLSLTRVLTVPVRCGTLYVDNRPHVLL